MTRKEGSINSKNFAAIIMAAGKGTRMSSILPKVLMPLADRPLLSYVIGAAKEAGADPIVVVTGHKREMVIHKFSDAGVRFATQEPQLGTGHAVGCAENSLKDFCGDILILSGDVPLIGATQISELISLHKSENASVTILTCLLEEPGSYGRIIRDESENIVSIVEAKDATGKELEVNEINSGVYVFDSSFLFSALNRLDNNNSQDEYYLTDLVAIAIGEDQRVVGNITDDPKCALGANTLEDLENLELLLKST